MVLMEEESSDLSSLTTDAEPFRSAAREFLRLIMAEEELEDFLDDGGPVAVGVTGMGSAPPTSTCDAMRLNVLVRSFTLIFSFSRCWWRSCCCERRLPPSPSGESVDMSEEVEGVFSLFSSEALEDTCLERLLLPPPTLDAVTRED